MKIILFLLLAVAVTSCKAQTFFKSVPKPHQTIMSMSLSDTVIPVPQQTQNVFRPVANLISYSVPDNRLLSGVGVGYEHIKFDNATQKWQIVWSINALAWYNVSLSDATGNRLAYGINIGLLNNLFLIGAATDSKKVFATVGIGIALNN